jgi:hypothetical protein
VITIAPAVGNHRPARHRVIQRGWIVFRDDNHLTATFSLAEAPVLGARIVGALASR